jgi:hypothetical protein
MSGCLVSVPLAAVASTGQGIDSASWTKDGPGAHVFLCEVDGVQFQLDGHDAGVELSSALATASGQLRRSSWTVQGLSGLVPRSGRLARSLHLAGGVRGCDITRMNGAHELLLQASLEVWIAAGFRGATNGHVSGLWRAEQEALRFVALVGPLRLRVSEVGRGAETENLKPAEGPLWMGSGTNSFDSELLRDLVHAGHGRSRRR